MTARADDLAAERIAEALTGDILGHPVQSFPVAVTTESVAIAWARQNQAPEGALVVADVELSARLRRGTPWTSVPGKTLAFSVVTRPSLPPEGEGLLWLLASLGVAEGIEAAGGVTTTLGWPDEIRADGRRLGSVRVDAGLEPRAIAWAVLTGRLNIALDLDDLADEGSTSLGLLGASPTRTAVLASILERLERRYVGSPAELLDAYRARCDTLGRRVRAALMPSGEASGTARDVDEGGRLVIGAASGDMPVGVDVLRELHVD